MGFVILATALVRGEDRILVADDKISIELASGWEETDLNSGEVLAGFATQDQRYSLFLNRFQSGGDMHDVLEATVANYAERFKITSEKEAVTGQAQGPGEKKWPAIYKSFEAEFDRGDQVFGMRFYLYVFDTGSWLYTWQGSATLPVREVREAQMIEIIRSTIAKP